MNDLARLIPFCILWMQSLEVLASQFTSFVAPPMKLPTHIQKINSFESSSIILRYTNVEDHEPSYVINDRMTSSKVLKTNSNKILEIPTDLQLENLPRFYYAQTKQKLNQEFLLDIEMVFGRIAIICLVVMMLHQVISQCSVIH
jgi:hypothetical protein